MINQYFTYVKSRRELLLGKIENLYKVSIEYTDTCSSILDDIAVQRQNKKTDYPTVSFEHRRQIQGIIRQMEMICGLYFPGSGFDPNDYQLWKMEILEHLEKGKFSEAGEEYSMLQDAKQHIINSDAKLAVICSRLMKKHGYKILQKTKNRSNS